MSDERDRAAEPNGQVRCLRRDYGSISFKDAPVDAAIGITVCLERRQDRVVGSNRFEPLIENAARSKQNPSDLRAEPEVGALSAAGGNGLVNCEPGLSRNPGPGITISRMQPAAPENNALALLALAKQIFCDFRHTLWLEAEFPLEFLERG
jgi:hypothetical protein